MHVFQSGGDDGHAHISRRSSFHTLLLTNVAELYSLPEISDNANRGYPLDIGAGNTRLVKTTALHHGTSSLLLQDNRAHQLFQTKRTRKVGVTGKYGTVRTSHP